MSAKDSQYSTPLIPASSATLICHATARINAPAALVFRTVRNTETWKDWNHFIPKVTIRHQPEEDDATNAEYADLVILSTSRALSVDSDLASSQPPASRRASTTSNGGPSAGQQWADYLQKDRRASVASNASSTSKPNAKPNTNQALASTPEASAAAPPEVAPVPAEHIFSQPSGTRPNVLVPAPPAQPSQFTSTAHSKRGSVSAPPVTAKRRLSINAIYGEPSVRLIVGTTLTMHMCMELPQHPNKHKDYAVIVTDVARPDDPLDPNDSNPLLRSTTHTASASGVYRIVWGSDNGILDVSRNRYPKWMLQFQRVTEIRPVYRGDGKEESEIKIWEGWKGIASKKHDKAYMQKWLQATAVGVKEFCESFGGAVDRRDFVGSG